MKKFLRFLFFLIIVLVALGTLAYYKGYNNLLNRWLNFSFCDTSVTYRLGTIDDGFETPRKDIVENTKEAGKLWNDIVGRELFIYDDDSNLTIDLIFDERQDALNSIGEQKQYLDEKRENLVLSVEEFEQKRLGLENQLNDLNEEIEYWNNKGGASKEKYRELTDRQDFLSEEIRKINTMADKLNRTTKKINNEVDSVNQKVENFNNLLSVLPEEGLYMAGPHKIEIYIYENDVSYIHTTAHELGHALGLDHVDQEDSIMYPVSSPDSRATESDLNLINNFCSEHNRIDLIKNDLKNMWYTLLAEMDFVVT
ncbi:matrixin family metalloprotease [Patescibacteria group bacterium]